MLLLTNLIYYLHTANGLALLFPECTLLAKYKEFFFCASPEVEGGDKR